MTDLIERLEKAENLLREASQDETISAFTRKRAEGYAQRIMGMRLGELAKRALLRAREE